MSSSFNSVDYFVILIFALSMLIGFIRGFLKEIISLLTWIAASVVASLFASKLAAAFGAPAVTSQTAAAALQNPTQANYGSLVALAISFIVLFIATLFVGYIVNMVVTGIVQGRYISLTNRLLGTIFGAIRGFIFVVVFMFVAELTPMGTQQVWENSQTVKAFAPTVKWFQDLVQPGLELIRTKAASAIQTYQSIKEITPSTSSIMDSVTSGAPVSSAIPDTEKGANGQ